MSRRSAQNAQFGWAYKLNLREEDNGDLSAWRSDQRLAASRKLPSFTWRSHDFAQRFASWLGCKLPLPTTPFTSPAPYDPVSEAAAAVIHDRKVASFRELVRNIQIAHAERVLPLEFASSTAAKFYVITQFDERPRILPLRLLRDGEQNQVQIRACGRWVQLGDYLDRLRVLPGTGRLVERSMLEESGYSQLSEWWILRNSTSGRLLELPRELRSTIYAYVLGPHIALESRKPGALSQRSSIRIDLAQPWPILPHFHYSKTPQPRPSGNLAFLATNRQIHVEVTEDMWKFGRFCLDLYHGFSLCCRLIPHSRLQMLSSLHIHGDFQDFFDLFAVEVPRGRTVAARCGARWFRYLNLSRLQLTLPAATRRDSSLFPEFERTCQDWMIDAVLSFALPYIQHIPHIILTGCIKHSTKAKWVDTFADCRKGGITAVGLDKFKDAQLYVPFPIFHTYLVNVTDTKSGLSHVTAHGVAT